MGLTESGELIEEHWIKENLVGEEEDREENQQENEQTSVGSGTIELHNNQLNKTQKANLLKAKEKEKEKEKKNEQEKENEQYNKYKLNEDEINEEKMWIEAISQEPKSSHLRNQLANHYFSQNRLKEAEFAYRAAINLDSTNSIAHYDYAFMRHHQFYWCLAKLNIADSYKYAEEAKAHYHSVLRLEENDIETHYQLSLLYLTMLETTLLESIDNIESALTIISIQYLNNQKNNQNNNKKGIYSPWYSDRIEIYELCMSHLQITMDLCSEIDPVLFGTYITLSRLLYLECIPNSFIYFTLTNDEKKRKLLLGIKHLKYALEINENDATLHHDLGLLLSHDLIGQYHDAIYHWLIASKLDNQNSIYTCQIAYIYQYYVINTSKAIKYYNLSLNISSSYQSQIWNNLGILSAQNAKKQADIVYATKCWRKCLSISPNHCEAHRNLGNIQWLHYYDKNKGEIHLQRAISISKQVLFKMNLYVKKITSSNNKNNKCEIEYYTTLTHKFKIFLAQCKSDYGGLLLMMFKYHMEAEKELMDAINYDPHCISAHYYLGKYLFEHQKDLKQSIIHLTKYIKLEVNKNIANRAHSHQILGEIFLLNQNYKKSQFHFSEAIKLSKLHEKKNKLPKWALCKIHCGFADSISKYESNKLYDSFGGLLNNKSQNILNQIRRNNKYNHENNDNNINNENNINSNNNNNISNIISNIEIAKKHYRLILKLDNKYVCAPLGLANIFGKIEGKIKLSDKHYNDSIKICKEKLIRLYKKYKIELETQNTENKKMKIQKEKMLNLIHQNKIAKFKQLIDHEEKKYNEKKEEKLIEVKESLELEAEEEEEKKQEFGLINNLNKKKKRFSDEFGLNMQEIDNILNIESEYDVSVIRVIKDISEYIKYCIEAHLGLVDLILISCHDINNKWKEALSHCTKIIYLDNFNILAHCKKSLIYFKLKQKNKAIQTAKYALQLAKEYDTKHKKNNNQMQKLVSLNLHYIQTSK